jgi:hypothetical protein
MKLDLVFCLMPVVIQEGKYEYAMSRDLIYNDRLCMEFGIGSGSY